MTLPACHTWPDFDNDGNDTGATVIGRDSAIAIVLDGPHRDAFSRLALAAPDLLAELVDLVDWLEFNKRSIGGEFLMDELLADARAAIAKAKGPKP